MIELARKRVLGIVGSPRRGGNTEVLVGAALRGAEEAGALVEKVLLSRLDISPCLACDACRDTDECVQQDDMTELLEKMHRSQVWVLGTPVYYYGPTAQFKAFLDRWYIGRPGTFKGRRVILAIPFEDSNIETARYTVGILSDSVAWKKAELFATVLAPGVAGPGDVRKHPDLLEAAYRAGRKAVETARYPYSAHRAILELDFCALYAGCIQHIVQLFGSALPSGELLGDGQHRLP